MIKEKFIKSLWKMDGFLVELEYEPCSPVFIDNLTTNKKLKIVNGEMVAFSVTAHASIGTEIYASFSSNVQILESVDDFDPSSLIEIVLGKAKHKLKQQHRTSAFVVTRLDLKLHSSQTYCFSHGKDGFVEAKKKFFELLPSSASVEYRENEGVTDLHYGSDECVVFVSECTKDFP